jgi:hypothetical protein
MFPRSIDPCNTFVYENLVFEFSINVFIKHNHYNLYFTISSFVGVP